MSDLSFDNPNAWVWLTLVAGCGLLALRSGLIVRAAQRRFVGSVEANTALLGGGHARRVVKAVLCLGVLIGLVLAWMGPRWGAYLERVRQRPIDIVVCLDVSRSMTAEDVGMSRLDRAKDDTRRLLRRLDGGNVGLVAFAGRGSILSPLTDDYDYVRMALDDADVHSAQVGGTDIGRAIASALKLFDDEDGRQRAIFLLTDGEDHNGSGLAFAQQAAERGVRVFAFGYGDTHEGTPIPIESAEGRSYLQHDGKQVRSRMDAEELSTLAAAGGGAFVDCAWGGDARAIERTYEREFATIDGKPIRDSRTMRKHARYQWPAAFALLLLAIETILPERRHERRRRAMSMPVRRAACISALVVFPLCEGHARAQWLSDPAATLVEEGNERLKGGEFDGALTAYSKAETRAPGTPELAFNKSIAFYRRGEFESAAAIAQDALVTLNRILEAKATYNLARSLHEAAIRDERNIESAMMKLGRAIGFYEDVLRLRPDHSDATKNLDMAERLMRFFEARLADERDRPQPRKGSQPQQGQADKESQQQTPQEPQQQDPQEPQQGHDKEAAPSDSTKSDGRQGESGKQGKSAETDGRQAARSNNGQQDRQTTPATIPIEEAEAMLQDARDTELRRRAVLRERAMRQQERTKPEKDW